LKHAENSGREILKEMTEFKAPHISSIPVDVSVLATGWLYLPDTWIFADGKPLLKHWSPDFSFLIRHHSGKSVLFDLGMRKVCLFSAGL
jgi:hypothetical protein